MMNNVDLNLPPIDDLTIDAVAKVTLIRDKLYDTVILTALALGVLLSVVLGSALCWLLTRAAIFLL